MTRDWDVIREILIRLEESKTPNATVNMKNFDGYDQQAVAYNMRCLHDAGCIEANILETSTGDNLIGAAIAKKTNPQRA